MLAPPCRAGLAGRAASWLSIPQHVRGSWTAPRRSGSTPAFTPVLFSGRLILHFSGRRGQAGSYLLGTVASLRLQVSLSMVLPRGPCPFSLVISGGRCVSAHLRGPAWHRAQEKQGPEPSLLCRRGSAGAGFSGAPAVSSRDSAWGWCQPRPRGEAPAVAASLPGVAPSRVCHICIPPLLFTERHPLIPLTCKNKTLHCVHFKRKPRLPASHRKTGVTCCNGVTACTHKEKDLRAGVQLGAWGAGAPHVCGR